MQLVIKREKDQGMLGGISFILMAKANLTPEEDALLKKYKVSKEVVYQGAGRIYTVQTLRAGIREKAKDITVLLDIESSLKNACENLKTLLEIMENFGGQEIIEY
jgi:hypothetical protein